MITAIQLADGRSHDLSLVSENVGTDYGRWRGLIARLVVKQTVRLYLLFVIARLAPTGGPLKY